MPYVDGTLDTKLNQNVVSGMQNKGVKTYLQVISQNNSTKSKQITENRAIQALLESTWSISSPDGQQLIPFQRLYQALWRTCNRMKPLDYMIHGTGQKQWKEKIVTDGVATVMERGGYDAALRDKNGAFVNLLLYGDGPVMVGMNPEEGNFAPVLYTPLHPNNLYMDNFASGLRNRGKAGSAYRAVVIFSYSWNQACEIWPKLKKIGGAGKIPRSTSEWLKTQERTWEQEFDIEDEVEIAFGWDIAKKNFVIFAGQACTVLEEYNGKEYPFIKQEKAYIPVLQFICIPSTEGAFNKGIGHLLYKLAIVSGNLLNDETKHAKDGVDPLTLVNVPQGEAANFFSKLAMATKMRNAGKRPMVAMEYDPNNPNSSQVSAQTLTTQNALSEWQILYNTLLDEIQMLGINLKELTVQGNPTATEILSDEENSQSWIKQVMEYNASESQEAIEITMQAITEFVKKKSDVPLNMTTSIMYEGQEMRPENITMGMLKTELSNGNWFVKVNKRTGANPSGVMLRSRLKEAIPLAMPGSKAQAKLYKMLMEGDDLDLEGEDFMPQQQGMPQGGGGDEIAGAMPSETQRMSFNPRTANQLPV